jgi:hypothetical protein
LSHVRDRRNVVAGLLITLVVIIIAYWAMWYGDRSLVASESASYYQNFESAFPLADGALACAMTVTAWGISHRRSYALFSGLAAVGGGAYLCGMDVLFDIEHGIWGRGGAGLTELGINALTLVASAGLGTWLWRHRREIDP